MKSLKVTFVANDPQKEAEYICYLAKNLTEGTFQAGDFYILPYAEKLNNKAVFFPDLKLSKEFWKKIADCKTTDLGGVFPKECIEEVVVKLPKSNGITSNRIINSWRKVEKAYFEEINRLFVGKGQKVKGIEFLLTDYGSLGSYYVRDGYFVATHRKDISPDDIGRTLLNLFIKLSTLKRAEIGEANWLERRSIVKFVLSSTKLKTLIPDARNTAPNKREFVLRKDSEAYLKRLGFYKNDHVFNVSQWGKITIKGKDIGKLFTPQEETVIKTLLKNKGEIVTFSDFANIPSLYALSKVMENIREKCRNLGINKELISTVRGRGYLLG